MAAKLADYSERERAVLQDCRRNTITGGLKWGLPSLLPLWVAFKARLLPRFLAPSSYTVAFVLFSLLGSMSQNDSCIEKILDMEDSELAEKLRKSLPRKARIYDRKKRKALEKSTDRKAREVVSMTTSERTDSVPYTGHGIGQQCETSHSLRGGYSEGVNDRDSSGSGGGDWMERQDKKGAVRRNKYGDIIFEDDIK